MDRRCSRRLKLKSATSSSEHDDQSFKNQPTLPTPDSDSNPDGPNSLSPVPTPAVHQSPPDDTAAAASNPLIGSGTPQHEISVTAKPKRKISVTRTEYVFPPSGSNDPEKLMIGWGKLSFDIGPNFVRRPLNIDVEMDMAPPVMENTPIKPMELEDWRKLLPCDDMAQAEVCAMSFDETGIMFIESMRILAIYVSNPYFHVILARNNPFCCSQTLPKTLDTITIGMWCNAWILCKTACMSTMEPSPFSVGRILSAQS